MSCYGLFDSTGDLGDFADTRGLRDFYKWAKTQDVLIAKFARDGYSKDPESLARVLRVAKAPDNVEAMREDLLAAADKARDILIVSEGPIEREERRAFRTATPKSTVVPQVAPHRAVGMQTTTPRTSRRRE